MKIKLLIRRKSGSTVTLCGVNYLFNDANDHTADITDEKHASQLLAQVPKVFVEVEQKSAAPSTKAKDPAAIIPAATPTPPATPESTATPEPTTTPAPNVEPQTTPAPTPAPTETTPAESAAKPRKPRTPKAAKE